MKTTGKNKIETMKRAGKILGEVLEEVVRSIKPGMTELEVDTMAEELILKKGGEPGFKKVPGYKHTICISVNNVVVHGIPGKTILKNGDIVGVDCGVYLEGYHTDMAETIEVKSDPSASLRTRKLKVKSSNEETKKFLETGKKAMFAGIAQAKTGNRVGHISRAMQEIIEGGGYSVVRNLVGHGVGRQLHEEPEIPGFLSGKLEKTPFLHEGMTIAIEIIYNKGGKEVVYDGSDDWTIVTKDGSISGLFERSLVVTNVGPELLTRFSDDSASAILNMEVLVS